jgi:MerR family redox-sensitive transcriptional activator SoxR
MQQTLTVEPKFKSSGSMEVASLTIGEVADRAGIATSAIRYYERRGLLVADERRSGQRRYREDTLRRLIFIGMLQDAGLSLDEIADILEAPDVATWKAIARTRLAALDEEIERLEMARAYLRGALLCRYDHPATDCRVMGTEIDRRLGDESSGTSTAPRKPGEAASRRSSVTNGASSASARATYSAS